MNTVVVCLYPVYHRPLQTYCEDLKELGLRAANWEPKTIAKDIDVKILG